MIVTLSNGIAFTLLWQKQLPVSYYYISESLYIQKVFWNIPEAYIRTVLVVLCKKCPTWWNVSESSMVSKSAWLGSLEISKSLYIQQLLITYCIQKWLLCRTAQFQIHKKQGLAGHGWQVTHKNSLYLLKFGWKKPLFTERTKNLSFGCNVEAIS